MITLDEGIARARAANEAMIEQHVQSISTVALLHDMDVDDLDVLINAYREDSARQLEDYLAMLRSELSGWLREGR